MTAKNRNDRADAKADAKPEAKAETRQPDPAPAAAPATTDTAIAAPKPVAIARPRRVKPPRGLELMQKARAELDGAVTSAMDELVALATDPKLPAEYQKLVTELVGQASTEKPGMEEVVVGWKIPMISINQPTTTATTRPESARLGDIYTSEGKVLERPFPFLVFSLFQENVNFPLNAKVPVCAAPDAQLGNTYGKCVECPHLPFGLQNAAEQKITDCQNQITAIVATTDMSKVYMVRFAKTSRKAGSALQSLAGASNRMWDNSFLLSTEKGQGAQGAYFIFKVEPTGKPNNEHVRLIAQTLCNLYRAERDRALADHYRAASAAPAAAAAAETAFEGSKLDAGLAGEAESYELGDGGGTPAAAGSVRSAAKPM
jgi:hypothetical protein